jgi:hypothetical protein
MFWRDWLFVAEGNDTEFSDARMHKLNEVTFTSTSLFCQASYCAG